MLLTIIYLHFGIGKTLISNRGNASLPDGQSSSPEHRSRGLIRQPINTTRSSSESPTRPEFLMAEVEDFDADSSFSNRKRERRCIHLL